MFLIVFIGSLYLIIGCITLFNALIFIELGRPKDLIQSGLIIILGIFLIIYKNIFSLKISLILTLNAVIINFYFLEIFSYRWNQLLDKEKFYIKSLAGFNKNFSIIFKIINTNLRNLFLDNRIKNLFKNTSIKKKWVRPKDNDGNSSFIKASTKESMNNIQTTDFSEEDMIYDEKNNTKKTKLDK